MPSFIVNYMIPPILVDYVFNLASVALVWNQKENPSQEQQEKEEVKKQEEEEQ